MIRFLCFVLCLYLIAFALVWIKRKDFLYPFDQSRVDASQLGLPSVKEYLLQTRDGETLVVWASPPAGERPTLLYFHGNAGNLADRAQRFSQLLADGYGLVALAYRGSAGSSGTPSEAVLIQDASLVREGLETGQFGWSPQHVIYYGESLGTGVAIALSETLPPTALILEAPFKSVAELAAKAMPVFPVRWVLDDQWNSLGRVQNLSVPLLVLHGAEDPVTPVAHGQAIFNAAGGGNKTMLTLQNTGHDVWTSRGRTEIFSFLENF